MSAGKGYKIDLSPRMTPPGESGMITERQVWLGLYESKEPGEIPLWLVVTQGEQDNGRIRHATLPLAQDALDALVRLYFMHRGTQALELDIRIAKECEHLLTDADREAMAPGVIRHAGTYVPTSERKE